MSKPRHTPENLYRIQRTKSPIYLISRPLPPFINKQTLSWYRLAILAPTSCNLEEFELGIACVKAALPLDKEQFPINPIKFFNFRGKVTVDN